MPPWARRNPNLGAELASEAAYKAAMEAAATAVVEEAKALAPVDDGDYRDGLEATTAEREGEVVGRANATDWKSHWVEWGSVNNPPHAPLRRGALAAGLEFVEGGQGG